MSQQGSVTVWLDRLKAGEDRDEAVARLWQRYFAALVRRAERYLRGRRSLQEGEDVALAVLATVAQGAEAGKFPKLTNREDLWQVLLRVTANKARNALRDESRRPALQGWGAGSDRGSGIPQGEPEPGEAEALAEGAEEMLAALESAELRQVALLALAGHSYAEIAAGIGKSVATAGRKLERIRTIWRQKGYAPPEKGGAEEWGGP